MKKRCKRSLTGIVAIILTLFLTGCARIHAQKMSEPELVIGGSVYAPYFYRDINGEYAGIDVEVAKEACRRIGYKPVIKEIEVSDRFASLRNGEVDCLWTCLTMTGREERYQWAGPYLYTQRVVAVHSDSSIQSLDDLKNRRVAVQAGSTSEQIILDSVSPDFPKVAQLTCFRSLDQVFTALRKGYVDAMVGHEGSLKAYTEEYPDQYRFLQMSLRSEPVGVAFLRDSDPTVTQQLNQAFQEMREDGTLEEIIETYDLDVEKNVYGGSADEQIY